MNLYGIKNLSGHQNFDTFSMAVITQNKYFDSQRIRQNLMHFDTYFDIISMNFLWTIDALLS